MNAMLSNTAAEDLLNCPAWQVGQMNKQIGQSYIFPQTVREKIRCKSVPKARELAALACSCGIDAFSRGSVLTLNLESWQLGHVDKFQLLSEK